MTRLFAVALSLCGGAAVAETPRMTQAQCDGGWARFIDVAYGMIPAPVAGLDAPNEIARLKEAQSEVTPDGWCRLDTAQPSLDGADFDVLLWQADNIDAFINSAGLPSQATASFEGMMIGDTAGYGLSFTVIHAPDDGLLRVNKATLVAKDGAVLQADAVIGGAYFRNVANLASSLGGLHVLKADILAEVTPGMVKNQFPNILTVDFAGAINALSFEQLDRASRREVLDFERALPEPRGTMKVTLQSERGLGILQFGMAVGRDGGPEALAFGLSGVTTNVDWQPE